MLYQLLFLIICQTIWAELQDKPLYDTNNYEAIGRHFENFIKTHEKQYKDETEKAMRFNIFVQSLKRINEFNSKFKATYDITRFSDMMKHELPFHGFGSSTANNGDCIEMGDPTSKEAPDAFDWRDHGAVSPIKNQGGCGSCWAFSTTGLVESRYLQKGKQLDLSEQQLVDCDKTSSGCGGGLMTMALTYIMEQGGQELEQDYPYIHEDSHCQFDKNKIAAQVQNCSVYSLSGEEALKELLFKEGPLSIAVDAYNFEMYRKGIYEICDFRAFSHAVLLVGYGSENGEDFWIIKDEQGVQYGEDGYMRMKRGVSCCGIGRPGKSSVVSAVVV